MNDGGDKDNVTFSQDSVDICGELSNEDPITVTATTIAQFNHHNLDLSMKTHTDRTDYVTREANTVAMTQIYNSNTRICSARSAYTYCQH